jgi:uncharacterized membrane protein YedE/YeeE
MSDMGSAPPVPPAPAPSGGYASENSKMIALLAYIFAPLGLIALALDPYKDETAVKLAAWQGAALWLIAIILSAVTFGIGWVLVFIYQIVLGIQSYQGKIPEVPVIYGLVKGMAGVA